MVIGPIGLSRRGLRSMRYSTETLVDEERGTGRKGLASQQGLSDPFFHQCCMASKIIRLQDAEMFWLAV
jgi:hypothetical protein